MSLDSGLRSGDSQGFGAILDVLGVWLLLGQDTVPRRTLARAEQPSGRAFPFARPTSRDLAIIAVTGVSYYAGARIGLLPSLVRGQVTPFWPPTGIAVVCALIFGLRSAPGVALAAFAVNAPLGPNILAAAAIALGNTAAPLAVVLLLRALKVSLDLARLRDSILFVLIAVSGMTISATWGTAVLRLSSGVSADRVWTTWTVWWAGDAMGVLVVAPVIVQLRRTWPSQRWPAPRLLEGAVLLGLVAIVVEFALSSPAGLLICPLIVWAAVRFRQLGAALVALEVAVLASATASNGHGPFASHSVVHSMLILQLFNAAIALTGLLLAASISQIDDARHDLGVANLMLSQTVEQRGAELDRDRSRLAVLADRYRIATQLHDTVLQRLFGIGTALEMAAASDGHDRQRLARLVDELDATVNELSLAIYQVEDDAPKATFREAIDNVIVATTRTLGVQAPSIVLTGDGELVPLALRPQLLAALHDGLNDVAGRPGIRHLSVAVAVNGDGIGLAVTADHELCDDLDPRAGIQRAIARATRLGGTCEWEPGDRQSTLTLQIPIA
jgi:integral membrane sensor domain MASE1